jgi:hypothetical protein
MRVFEMKTLIKYEENKYTKIVEKVIAKLKQQIKRHK